MSKRFFVFKKYVKGRGCKIIGGKARFVERTDKEISTMRKIIGRIHNDEEYFLRKQTTFRKYKEYFLSLRDSRWTRD